MTERLYVMLMAFSLAVLALAAVGCGDVSEVVDEHVSAIIVDTNSGVFTGYAITDPSPTQVIASHGQITDKPISGTSGDAWAMHVGIGGMQPGTTGTCVARSGVINQVGGGHSFFVAYVKDGVGGTAVGTPVLNHSYVVDVYTLNGGATMNFRIVDVTPGSGGTVVNTSVTKPGNCSFAGESAQWLVERPVLGSVKPLANFGQAGFADSYAISAQNVQMGMGVWPTSHITMVNAGHNLATSGFITGGTSFVSSWAARL